MNITFIGIGQVGFALADNLVRCGHTVTIATYNRQSPSARQAVERNPALTIHSIADAVADADVIFLAMPFNAIESVLRTIGDVQGKIIVDCTNPVGPGLTHGLNNAISGGEFVQNLVPSARVVKAFTIYGFENFIDSAYPGYGDLKPAMLIAGNDGDAKNIVGRLCTELGWEPVDTGDISMSLHLEHLALLWIKMGRVQGYGAGFVWAMLRRSQ